MIPRASGTIEEIWVSGCTGCDQKVAVRDHGQKSLVRGRNPRETYTKDLNFYPQGLSYQSHLLQTFLIVRSTTANEDSDFVTLKTLLVILQRIDNSAESGRDIGEIGNSSSNNKDLAFRVGLAASHEVQDSLGVLKGLILGGSTRVFTVIGQFVGEAMRSNGVAKLHDPICKHLGCAGKKKVRDTNE